MQWTDESGRAYGEDPYGGAGYAYAYGYEHGGSAPTDTATMPWAPEQVTQQTHPAGHAHVAGTDPYTTRPNLYVIATDPYAAGPNPATTGWDAPHGDMLTVPPPELDPPGSSAPGPGAPKSESVRPVFVDSSGRRQRRVLRAARLLVIPAGGYVALLISTLLGGPTLNAPFVPQPDSPHPTTPRATAPDASSGTGHSAGNGSPAVAQTNSRLTPTQKVSGSADQSTASAASAAAAPGPTAASTGIASPTATPTATTNPHSKGRAVGSSHNPVK
ncbi:MULTISPECIES: hypothetical protein [unclassified Streptomyces]|uniref:hypothetical protein n=1 Tax=unclassified Streptomyces TaxID=2593676 RepID=UPI003D944CE5